MGGLRRKWYWFLWVLGLFLAVALTLQFLAPRIIDLAAVRSRIEAALSKVLGGEVTVQSLDLSILPRPCVNARILRISLPGTVEGTVDSLSIYPRVLPLFRGKLRLAQITAEAPELTVTIGGERPGQKKSRKPATLQEVKEAVSAAGARLAALQPGLTVVIHRGKVALLQGRTPPVIAEHIDAKVVLPPAGFIVNLDCHTPFWENLMLKARLDPVTFAGDGSIEVEALKPHLLGPYLFPGGPSPVGESLADLELSFKTDGARNLQAKLAGSAPRLRLLRGRKTLFIEGAQFKGSVELDERKTVITVDGLEAASPHLALTGKMHIEEAAPRAGMTVTGSDIDIGSVRQAALSLAPEDPTVQAIFAVLRAGNVPALTFESTGRTSSDLGDLERMHITAAVRNGAIDIPGTPLHLAGTSGTAVISGGILQGDRLAARLGAATAQNGTLRLGLRGGDAPFHLDITVKADLAELPPVLRAFINDRSFLRELGLLRDIKGDASGRLVLGESTRAINVTTDISAFEMTAAYQRVPFPLRISGGRFFFDGKKISLERISAGIGRSTLADLAARLDLAAPTRLDIQSARISLDLDEVYPWLSSFPAIKQALKGVEAVRGTARLSIQHAGLPLAGTGNVQFSAAGSVEDLTVRSNDLPGPLTVAQGSFTADRDRVSITNADAAFLDASLKIGGRLNGYLGTPQGGELTATGSLGEKAVHWLSESAGLPPEAAVRSPLSVSQTRLAWKGKDSLSVSGTVSFPKGPGVAFDVLVDPQRLAINALRVQDGDNRADIRLKVEKKTVDLAFSGALREGTLEHIFANERFHHGRLSGDLQAHIPLDRPRQSTVRGTLDGEHLIVPLAPAMPAVVDRLSLRAEGSRITVVSADISLGATRLFSSGTVTVSSAGYLLDGDLSADKVDVDAIAAALGKAKEQGGNTRVRKGPPKSTWDLPLQGTVRFNAGSASYGGLTAGSVRADIELASYSIRAAVREAELCGISLPGMVAVTPADIALDLSPAAERRDLGSTLACLGSEARVSGTFSARGRLATRGTASTLLGSLHGKMEVTATNGSIYYDTVVVKVLSFLSVNELMRGRLPDPARDGVPFSTWVVKGTLRQGIFHVTEYSVDGPVVDVAGQGDVDLVRRTLNLTVVVAPFTITTEIVRNIPGLNYVLNGTLVTFPLHVEGPFFKVAVNYNPVTAVGKGIFGILKRIVEIPLQPFESNKKDE